MKMKYFNIILFALIALISCDTDIENIGYEAPDRGVDYEALRAYKASDHEFIFGWFGGWNGGAASMSSSLRSLPDSMDMVSIWGEWQNISDLQKEDMKYVQEVKGTKVLACIFTPTIGRFITPEGEDPKEYWGWSENQEEAMRKYSRALVEHIIELGYDGIDMDNEKESGNVYGDVRLTSAFVEVVGEYMGPSSGTGRIFCIDGSFTAGMKAENNKHVNFFIEQAYNASSYTSFDSSISSLARFYKGTHEEMAKKFLPACDFELNATVGGGTFYNRDGTSTTKAEGFAKYKPVDSEGNPIMKGGSGMYHIENDYKNSPFDYYYTRRAIQIMNPAQ